MMDLLDSKVHGAHLGPIWGRQDPGGPHVVCCLFSGLCWEEIIIPSLWLIALRILIIVTVIAVVLFQPSWANDHQLPQDGNNSTLSSKLPPDGSNLPHPSLRSLALRRELRSHLVRPALQAGFNATLLRMTWRPHGEQLQQCWQNIVALRTVCDNLVTGINQAKLIVSSVNGIYTRPDSAGTVQNCEIFPAVTYWIVHQVNMLEYLDLKYEMESKLGGVFSTVKRNEVLEGEDRICAALFRAAKDHRASFIHRMIWNSLSSEEKDQYESHVTKVFVLGSDCDWIHKARNELASFNMPFKYI